LKITANSSASTIAFTGSNSTMQNNLSQKGQALAWIVSRYYGVPHAITCPAMLLEAWLNGELVGGLYGVRIGNIFLVKVCLAK